MSDYVLILIKVVNGSEEGGWKLISPHKWKAWKKWLWR
jgi:hypothetical protein